MLLALKPPLIAHAWVFRVTYTPLDLENVESVHTLIQFYYIVPIFIYKELACRCFSVQSERTITHKSGTTCSCQFHGEPCWLAVSCSFDYPREHARCSVSFWQRVQPFMWWPILTSSVFWRAGHILACLLTGWLQRLIVTRCHLACDGCKKKPWLVASYLGRYTCAAYSTTVASISGVSGMKK